LGRRFPRVGLGVCPGISRLSTFLHKRYHLTARIYNGGGTPRRHPTANKRLSGGDRDRENRSRRWGGHLGEPLPKSLLSKVHPSSGPPPPNPGIIRRVIRTSAWVIPPCGAYVQWRGKPRTWEAPTAQANLPPGPLHPRTKLITPSAWPRRVLPRYEKIPTKHYKTTHPTKVDAGRRNFGRCIACTLHGKCRSSSPWRRKNDTRSQL
jgi:hypothetical protein